MKTDRRPTNRDEIDVYSGWRAVLAWTKRPGAVKRVKKRTHRGDRRLERERLRRPDHGD